MQLPQVIISAANAVFGRQPVRSQVGSSVRKVRLPAGDSNGILSASVGKQKPTEKLQSTYRKIGPHRFGGEGVLIGGQNSNTKCSMTFVNIAVAISALAGGGGKNGFAPRPEYGGVFDIFRGFLGV